MTKQLFIEGNSAKVRIMDILVEAAEKSDQSITVLDFGAGRGGYWKKILDAYPNINLLAFEPMGKSFQILKKELQNYRAVVTDDLNDLKKFERKVDFIISFSVFEHVQDKDSYLNVAKNMLSEKGIFFLNYDDGHFRNRIELSSLRSWTIPLKEFLKTAISFVLSKIPGFPLKKIYVFQQRVKIDELNQLLSKHGMQVHNIRYENLESMKNLAKYIPKESLSAFNQLWIDLEDKLNNQFLCKMKQEKYGDSANLWTSTTSKTMTLTLDSSV